MKIIGLIGGMSWESSEKYYRLINGEVKNRLGGLHSAKCLLYSVDFAEIERYQSENDWKSAGKIIGDVAKTLERAGANFIILCTNTMHKVVKAIQNQIHIPILHIADATAKKVKNSQVHTVGLLGTKWTMEQDFYRSRMESNGIKVIVPNNTNRDIINKVIFEELCIGEILQSSRDHFKKVIKNLITDGAEGIVLGCTELGLLVRQDKGISIFRCLILQLSMQLKQLIWQLATMFYRRSQISYKHNL